MNGCAPGLAVLANEDFVVLHAAVGSVLAGCVDEALHVLDGACVEVNPVGIFGQGHTVHGVPDGAEVAVDKVAGIAFTALYAGGIDNLEGHALYLVVGNAELEGGVVLVPSRDGAAAAQVDSAFVGLHLLIAADGVLDGLSCCAGREGEGAHLVAVEADGLVAGGENARLVVEHGGHGAADVDGADDEAEVGRLGLATVGCERSALSATVAAETRHLSIEVEVDILARGQLIGVSSAGEFHLAPGQCAGRHQAVGDEGGTAACGRGECAPAHLFAVAHSLGFGQHDFVLAHGLLIEFDEGARLAVVVVVDRSTAVVVEVFESLGQFHRVAEAAQVGRGLVASDGALEFNASIGIDGPYLVGRKLEVVGSEGVAGVVLRVVHRVLVAVRVAIAVAGAVGSLAFHGEGQLDDACLGVGSLAGGYDAVLEVVEAVFEPRAVAPVVVVGRCAEGVEARSVTFGDDGETSVFQTAEATRLGVKLGCEVLAADHLILAVFLLLQCALLSFGHCGQARGFLDEELLFHLYVALFGPRCLLVLNELHLGKVFALRVEFAEVVGEGIGVLCAGLVNHARTLYGLVLLNANAVLPERPYDGVVREVGKVVLVHDFHLARLGIEEFYAHVLIHLLDLVILCLGAEVGAHNAVHAEHTVVGLVAEVAAVAPVGLSRLAVVVDDGLVHPVPDGAADEVVGALHGFPVVHEVAHGVTHRVGVLGDVVGVLHVVRTLDSALHPSDGGVLVGADVDDVVVALVLHGARGVEGLDGLVGGYEVLARASFVAERPEAYGGMVHVGVYHFHVAGHVGIAEFLHVGEAGFAVIVFVAFDVGFVFEVDAVFIAEVVPVGVAGIVRVAHVVDVAALHEHHLVFHLLAGDGMAQFGAVLVAVDTLHLDGLSVEIVVAAGQTELVVLGSSLLDFYLAESDDGRECFHHLALLVLQLSDEGVAVGLFGAPGLHLVASVELEAETLLHAGLQLVDGEAGTYAFHGFIVVAVEFVFEERIGEGIALDSLLGEVDNLGVDAERSIGEGGVVVGCGHEVAHLHKGLGG